MKQLVDLDVNVLAGSSLAELQQPTLPPYARESVAFLTAWSRHLFAVPDIRDYPDAANFAFWCRSANLASLQREFGCERPRLGRGVAVHIAPANVPVNFAFSFAFGLLAGNLNIVRVPERLPAQADILCATAKQLLSREEHARVASMNTLLTYPRDDDITQRLSAVADVRLLWGGDQTINHLRSMPASPRCVDVTFADRYSLCLLSAPAVLAADSSVFFRLTVGFYNDVFLFDQGACSSPHLVLWQGSAQEVNVAQARFWGAMHSLLQSKQKLPAIHAVEKYTHLCRTAIQIKGAKAVNRLDNRIFRVQLDELPDNISAYRGRYGFLFETIDKDFHQLRRIVNTKYQTLTCFGFSPNEIVEFVAAGGLRGIDRVVPVGKALDIGSIWDGYDLIRSLSRIIATQ